MEVIVIILLAPTVYFLWKIYNKREEERNKVRAKVYENEREKRFYEIQIENPEHIKLIREKGLSFNGGNILFQIDGEKENVWIDDLFENMKKDGLKIRRVRPENNKVKKK